MLTKYGHARIEFNSKSYDLIPSFINISKLGTPAEIIELFKMMLDDSPWYCKFDLALTVLECCHGKPLPVELTGKIEVNGWNNSICYLAPKHTSEMFNDVIALAMHCLKHAIVGDVDYEPASSDKALEEFDPYEFIELAIEHLNCSRDDAANMTMTEFVRRMRLKFPPKKEEETATEAQQRAMVEYMKSIGAH